MRNEILLKKIYNYQQFKDPKILEELILQFTPLLKKYASNLLFEDSMQEFYLLFIQILNKIPLNNFTEDKYIVSYISTAIKNKYINLSKKNFKNSSVLELDDRYFIEKEYSNSINDIDLILSLSNLSHKERYIIYSIFFECISINDLSKKLKVSRQSINQTKLRALNKLKKEFFK